MEKRVSVDFNPCLPLSMFQFDLRFAESRTDGRKRVEYERPWGLAPQNYMNLTGLLQFGCDQFNAQTFVGHKHPYAVTFPGSRMNCHHQITGLIGSGHNLNQSAGNLRNMLFE